MADEDNEYNSLFVEDGELSEGENTQTTPDLEKELEEIQKLTKEDEKDKNAPTKEVKKDKKDKKDKKNKKSNDEEENEDKKIKLGNIKNKFSKMGSNLREKIKKGTVQNYLYIAKVLIIILLLLGSVLMVLISYAEYKERRKDIIEITQDMNSLNNSNYIYVNEEFVMDNNLVTMKKIRLDTIQSNFYFDNGIDITKYRPILVDYIGKTYYYNKMYGSETTQKVITFDGLDEGIQKFNLILDDIENPDESIVFKFELTEEFVKTPTRYIVSDIAEADYEKDDNFDVNVTNGLFSSAVSKVSFVAKYKNNKHNYRMKPVSTTQDSMLTEKGSNVVARPEFDEINIFEDKSIILGTLFFDPVLSLNGKVTMNINNVIEYYTLNKDIPLKPLLMREESILELGQFDVTLEGAKKYDDAYVVVLHAVDNLYSPPQPTIEITKDKFGRDVETVIPPVVSNVEHPERVIAYVKAHMNVTADDGSMFTVYGEQRYGQEGSDVVFRDERLLSLTSENIQFVIEEITFDIPPIVFEIDLAEQGWNRVNTSEEFLSFVKESFYSRLKYKSSEVVRSQITGFSDDVLDETMVYYNPVVPDRKANYDISVISYSKYHGGYVAIVQGEWRALVDGKWVRMNNKHKIEVEVTDDGFLIVSDEIVQ